MSFAALEKCTTTWWADFKLVNTSGELFKSISISLSDADTLTVTSQDSNGFTNKDGCGTSNTTDSLVAGGTVTVSSPPLGYNPSGHNLNVKITVCTNTNLTGTCVKKELTFKP